MAKTQVAHETYIQDDKTQRINDTASLHAREQFSKLKIELVNTNFEIVTRFEYVNDFG